MRYGYFDDAAREYVIDRVDVPQSMTNYLGTQRMGTVISHNAGGYSWLDSPQHHRITRFRPNGVPMDWPGHYVYLRDEESGKYWSVSCSSYLRAISSRVGRSASWSKATVAICRTMAARASSGAPLTG